MSENLSPDGTPVFVGGVDISAIGLSGLVEVHLPGSTGMRAAEDAQPMLLSALKRSGFIEHLTVEIAETQAHPEYLAGPGAGRGTGEEKPEITVTVPGAGEGFGEVLLACDEDGVLTWHLAEDTAKSTAVSRTTQMRTFRLPAHVVGASSQGKRGLMGALGKKLLKVLFFKLADHVLGVAGNFFVSRYEQARIPHRLRLITAENYQTGDVPNLGSDDLKGLTSGRALLFLHGTASSTHKAFGLLPHEFVSKLTRCYEGRVFGFDHPTLSVTPMENVQWLSKVLNQPAVGCGLDVDIIAHSRGGLVGRAMSECGLDAGLGPRQLRVHNFIMVATPNAGTPLADRKHLGAFIDTFANLLEFIPDNPASDTLDVVLAMAKQLAIGVMGGLSGLESMDPRGRFLREVLNKPSNTKATYFAVAANFEPAPNAPLGRYARDFLTDLVFEGQENDLVVPTEGVFAANGGTGFPISSPLSLQSKEAVDHSGFWNKQPVLDAITQWLELPKMESKPVLDCPLKS